MTTAEILRAAMAMIEDPAHWTQGAFRRNAAGQMCQPESAVCWCAEGAVLAVTGSADTYGWDDACAALDRAVGGRVANYNDNGTHTEVLDVFRRAIALAEGRT